MEFAYTGLIVGNDLFYRDGKIQTNYTKHPKGAGEFKRPYQQRVLPEDGPILTELLEIPIRYYSLEDRLAYTYMSWTNL